MGNDASHERRRPGAIGLASACALLALGWLAFFSQLGGTGLFENAEPLFAQAALEMVESGDWVTPRVHGEPRYDKPALMYWLIALGYLLWGVGEWAVRFPSALAAFGLTCAVFVALLRLGGNTAHPRRRA